jgi:hypothetical protein
LEIEDMRARRFLLLLGAAACWAGLGAAGASAAASAGTFRITLDPPPAKLAAAANPDSPKKLTDVEVEALGPDGRRQSNAIIEVTLTAPRFGTLVRSDVPRIEGRELLHTRFFAPDGVYRFRYVWPIRGDYRVDLRAEPAPGTGATFASFTGHQTITVPERSGELTYLVLYLAVLFALGALATLILVRSHRGRSDVDGAARLRPSPSARARLPVSEAGILGILVLGLVGFLVFEQVKDDRADRKAASYQGAGNGLVGQAASGPVVLRYGLSRSNADGISVQTLLSTSGDVEDAATGRPIPGAGIRLEAVDLETDEVVYSTEAVTSDGRFTWHHDFWDGVTYDLRLTALTGVSGRQFDPITATLKVDVTPMSPPLGTKLLGMAYSLFAFLVGMAVILVLAQRRRSGAARALRPFREAPAQ